MTPVRAESEKALETAPDAMRGAQRYQTQCASCHAGSAVKNNDAPLLGGQKQSYLLRELQRMMASERIAPTMHRVLVTSTTTFGPQAARELAAYLASEPWVPSQQHGDGSRLMRGERLYKHYCAQCHAARGQGSEAEAIPALGGQQFGYLRNQLHLYATGHRNEVDRPLVDFTAGLNEADRTAIADYLSRIAIH